METLEWNDSYGVGVEEIDRQHQRLFELVNILGRAVADGREEDIIGHVLVDMAGYAEEHFKSEQLYLEKHADFKDHFMAHWDFTKKCMELVFAFRKDKKVSADTLNYLIQWLKKHILEVDRQFFKELGEQGLL
ncbi:MAG: bacteriohemerythrin [Proteobacteria bacterium]|nr:bacteriohemerythrin [Pseudomonadota bacterium]MBU1737128.1 bacteriohemerythrin [Pseudomonadota bacterium]